ncbi:transmembrane protein 183B-like [Anneissia japonica]|uniref:transmembrane protein 183B-like n=1 Tax=Anneissia japonica TaxID=1529436 RepID=UPI0014255CDB|nr:transmembrane protein 183B-like [Anneissia japonica]
MVLFFFLYIAVVTINDYANTSSPHPPDIRNTKKLNCCITNKVQKMDIVDNNQQILEDNLKWYEKDDFEFEMVEDAIEEIETNENNDIDFEADTIVKLKRQGLHTHQEGSNKGVVFPAVIWFLLSKYIAPEDVWRFACLCYDACAVTNTVAFWRSLYFRYKDEKIKLPRFLSSELIEGIYGVRYLTICALYIMYEPFRRRTVIHTPIGEGSTSPYTLINQICKYTWSEYKPGGECTCYLLFEDIPKTKTLLQFDNDIYANNFKNQTILRVYCRSFQNLPQAEIMGLQLSNVFFNVSSDMRNHKLRLIFQGERKRGYHRANGSQVPAVLDPVIWVHILHWWHPQFLNCKRAN